MRKIGPSAFGEKRITPSRLHAPPRGLPAFASVCTAPPSISIRLSLPSAKNPSDRLSGDQKGKVAPSVPGSGRAERESRGRSHNRDWLPSVATNAIVRPSGEIANEIGSAVEGVVTSTRNSGAWAAG